jgi:hypothetical protein
MLSTSYQSPKFSLTSVLPHSRSVRPSTLGQVVSTWTLCGGRLAPRRANERYTSEPAVCARLVCQAYHRHPGCTRLSPPHASTRSLLMPTEQGLSTPGSYAWLLSHASQAEMTPTREPAAPTYFRPPSPFAAPSGSRRRSFMR